MIETIGLFGREISLYYTFWFVGAICVLVGGYFLGKRNGFGFSKSILYVVGAVLLGYLLLWGTSWMFGGGKMIGLNFIRIVCFMPIPIFLLARVFGDNFWDVSDFIAPLLAIFHGVTHIGCVFPGCCHGYPAQWGLFSNNAGAVCFPIQPIEAASSIIIGVLLAVLFMRRKQHGKLYAWYLLLYGSTRFVWEFLRDNEKIWHGISELAFHALGAAILGLAALVVMRLLKKGNKDYEKK